MLTGGGEKFFLAGADLNVLVEGDKKTAKNSSDILGQAFLEKRKPLWLNK